MSGTNFVVKVRVLVTADLDLLREQKAKVYSLANDVNLGHDSRRLLDGVLTFLDDIQDQLADAVGEDAVFGKQEDE